MGDHVFISYSRVDESEVRKLYTILVNKGYDCWLDVERIPSGSDWDSQLQKAIEDCSHIVVICTPSSMSSKNVLAEWQYAFELKKSIHPIIIVPCEIPFRLRIYQNIDATKLGLEKAVHKLIESLPTGEFRTTDYDTNLEKGVSKVRALITRSVQNWHAFGLLLEQSGFSYIDTLKDELTDLDASTVEFLYLSLRKLKHLNTRETLQYWTARVKQHSAAADSVENVIIDGISETSLDELQVELESFASRRLAAKIAQIINVTDDHLQISLLLDTAIRLLTKSQPPLNDFSDLENTLYQKQRIQPNQTFARALEWIESPKILNDVQAQLAHSHPKSLSEFDRQHLVCLANMQNSEAVSILERFTPSGFSFVPAGWFLMGSNSEQQYLESPEHEVFVPSFWLRKIPVTETEFEACHLFAVEEVMTDFPAHNISWTSAINWINKVAQGIKLPLALPTEAMWEKAASWDPNQKRKQLYPWGDERDYTRCNTVESNRNAFTPVGAFSPNGDSPYGISDMVGNVWEWTSTPMRPYPYQPRIERELRSGEMRIMRGPSMDARRGLRPGSATRISFEENYSFSNAGLRVAIVVDI
jgi:hypothetical protein